MNSYWNDRIIAIVALFISAITFVTLLYDVPGTTFATFKDMESAAFFPMLAATVIGVSALFLVIGSLKTRSMQSEELLNILGKRPALIVIGFSLFIPLIDWLGMITASMIMIAFLPLVFGYQNYRWIIPVAVLLPIAVYLLFERTLNVLFPHGVVF